MRITLRINSAYGESGETVTVAREVGEAYVAQGFAVPVAEVATDGEEKKPKGKKQG